MTNHGYSVYREASAIINRMGFNNKGVDYLVENVKKAQLQRCAWHQYRQKQRHAKRAG